MQDILPVLTRYPPECRPLQVEPLGSAGGLSGAQFWRVTTHRGILMLRRWPTEHPTPERLSFIHAVLDHAAQRDISYLPVPIRATSGDSFVAHAGHLWELAPWLPGAADFVVEPSVEKIQAAMRAIANFHTAVADFQSESGPSPTIARRLATLRHLASGGADELGRAISGDVWPDLAPLARQFVDMLPVTIPRAIALLAPLVDVRFRLQPCLRDVWHDHILFTGNEVTGVVDFGAIAIDTPACDIARLLGSLDVVPHLMPHDQRSNSLRDPNKTVPLSETVSLESLNDTASADTAKSERSTSPNSETRIWRAGLAAYSALRPLTPDETHAVHALDASGASLAGCNWLRWIYVDRRQFDNPAQVAARFRAIAARAARP